jgi:uncharacterized protein (TIGR00106 family)
MDKGESVSEFVARAVAVVEKSGFDYRLHAMGTIIETQTVAEALGVVQKCFDALEPDCRRISCSVKIDFRRGKTNRLVGKVASVEQKIGRRLKSV